MKHRCQGEAGDLSVGFQIHIENMRLFQKGGEGRASVTKSFLLTTSKQFHSGE